MHDWLMRNHPWYKKKFYYEEKMKKGEILSEKEKKEYMLVCNSHRRMNGKAKTMKIALIIFAIILVWLLLGAIF